MRLSTGIQDIFATQDSGDITVGDILDRITHQSFGIFLIVLALPSALPLPAPGYSIPFGLVLVLVGLQMIAKRETPWFPERLRKRKMKSGPNSRLVRGMVKALALMEKVVRPRLRFIYQTPLAYRLMGGIVTSCGISMCIPIPLTNTMPALGIFLLGIGLLEEDGIVTLLGMITAFVGILITLTILTLIVYYGLEVVDYIKAYIKGLLGLDTTAPGFPAMLFHALSRWSCWLP